ncbi:MAG: Rpn family recombination-promoting nuclease/putative transposase [Treponema sp.]|nr:Rpn family recombination-promoting nuclease/putative transposase [Treponema sp.]
MEAQIHTLSYSSKFNQHISRNIAQGKELNIRCDAVFKSLFSKNTPESKGALCYLIGAATGQKVENAEVMNSETTSDMLSQKVIRMDIKCRFCNGQLADIEMQKKNTGDVDKPRKRMNYYNARLMAGQIESGESAGGIADCHQISFLDYKEFNDERYYHHIRQYDQYGNLYDGGFHLHFFELVKLKTILTLPVEELSDAEICGIFLKYEGVPEYQDILHEIYSRKEGVRMAKTVLNKMSKDMKEWAMQETRHRYETDYMLAQIHQKHLAEKAIREGHEKGLRKGREEGRQEGAMQAKREDARNMKKVDIPAATIAQCTGLSKEEITQL